jgi:hypothetical protein
MPSAYLIEGGQQLSFWKIRLFNIINFFRFSIMMEHGMGIYLTLLGVGGLLLTVIKRESRLLLIAAFPLIYLFVAILGASPSIRLQDTIPLYPYAALLTSIFIYWVLGRVLRLRWLLNSIFAVCGLVLLSPYVLSMLRMDYGYWQPDTTIYATEWARKNIPPGSLVAREKKTLDLAAGRNAVVSKRRLCNSPVQAYKDQGFQYLVTSSRQANRMKDKFGLYGPEHPFGRFYSEIESEYNLLKTFDLGIIPYKGGVISIYELKQSFPLCPDGLNSSILRCLGNEYSYESPSIIFLDKDGRSEGNTGFQVGPESREGRLMISPRPLSEIAVQVVNGSEEGTIRILVGGEKVSEKFQPRQIRQFVFPARTGFPYIQYSYRIKVSSIWNSSCLVRVLTDPYRIGLGFLRCGEPERAIKYLETASRLYSNDWLIYNQLAGAYDAVGRGEDARSASLKVDELFPGYRAVRDDLLAGAAGEEGWGERFKELSGYDFAWLQSRLTVTRPGKDLLRVGPDGITGARYYTQELLLPCGQYEFICELSARDYRSDLNLIKITIRKNHQIILEEKLTGANFSGGIYRVVLESHSPGTVFGVEIEELSPLGPGAIKIKFIPELIPWLEKLFN